MVRSNEFKEVFKEYRLKIHPDDIQKLIDRYINTIGETIDTNVMLEQMYHKMDSHRERSNTKGVGGLVDNDITIKVAKKLEKKGLSRKIISNLLKEDREQTHYLSFKEIKQAFHKGKFELSTRQVEDLLAEIKQNRHGEYNYHILLCSLFGEDYQNTIKIQGKTTMSSSKFARPKSMKREDKYERSKSRKDERSKSNYRSNKSIRRADSERSRERDDKRSRAKSRHSEKDRGKSKHSERSKTRRHDTSRSKSRHREERKSSARKSQSRGRKHSRDSSDNRKHHSSRSKSKKRGESKAKTSELGKYLHKKFSQTRHDYVSHIKTYAGDDIDYILTDKQAFKIIEKADIRLSSKDKQDLIRDLDGKKFTVGEFLNYCDLDKHDFKTVGLDTEVLLTTEEENQAKKALEKVGLAIEEEKKEFEKVFNIGPFDKEVDFSEFKYALEGELNDE